MLPLRRVIQCSRWQWVRTFSKVTATEPVATDPFGIDEVIESSATTVVQGFYGRPPKDNSDPGEISPVVTNSNMEKYAGWIDHREKVRKEQLSEGESVRVTSFGNVRLDTDNVVSQHGQFDQKNSEPVVISKERITAADFLKTFKKDQVEAASKQNPILEKPTNPRSVKQNLIVELDKLSPSSDHDHLDSNIIPKVYQLPAYNEITKQDMWSILKKSVIFNNDFILAINKPAGVPIHSSSIDCRHFITEFLDRLSDYGQCPLVYPLHRLDKETTGVLLFAKDPKVASIISQKLATRQVEKKYLVITKLCPRMPEGTIKIPIGEGKVGGTQKYRSVLKPDLRKYEIQSKQGNCREAVTHFKVLKSMRDAAFLEVMPETGLKHQIRIHLGLGLGCPVIGDHKYSHRDRMAPQRLHPNLLQKIKVKQSKVRELPLHLHCSSMSFTLPEEFTKSPEPIYVHAKVPRYFNHTLNVLGL